ncbi:MAG: hypothetical protein U5L72_02425 [Bacteroidales bacterium]|nr:hypothetical protein [Bacteroidales bacterium]
MKVIRLSNTKRRSLPSGLARIKIADSKGVELGSRWYYNGAHRPGINCDVKFRPATLSRRDKAEISIKATDAEGNGIETGLSRFGR